MSLGTSARAIGALRRRASFKANSSRSVTFLLASLSTLYMTGEQAYTETCD